MVRDFQSVIGREARAQMLARYGRLPHTVVACVGGGSNAMGIFTGFVDDADVRLVGVEAAGEGIESGHHSATLSAGTPGVLHGSLSYLLQDADGQVAPAHSISAGLDYPGVGPEHSCLSDTGRVALRVGHRRRGARRVPGASAGSRGSSPRSRPPTRSPGCAGWRGAGPPTRSVLVCLSGRGDKDVAHVAALLGSARVTSGPAPTDDPARVRRSPS